MTNTQKLATISAILILILVLFLLVSLPTEEPPDSEELPRSQTSSAPEQPARSATADAKPASTAPDHSHSFADSAPVDEEPPQPPRPLPGHDSRADQEVSQAPQELSITIDDLDEAVGPARWMAQPHDVDVEALEEELHQGAMDQEFEIALRRDRRRSIEVVDAAVQDCYRAWRRRGIDAEIVTQGIDDSRVALGWTLNTEAGRGRVEDPQILHQLGPRDGRFEACLIDNVDGLRFQAVGDGANLEVQWAMQPN